jgi:hypothetical protein
MLSVVNLIRSFLKRPTHAHLGRLITRSLDPKTYFWCVKMARRRQRSGGSCWRAQELPRQLCYPGEARPGTQQLAAGRSISLLFYWRHRHDSGAIGSSVRKRAINRGERAGHPASIERRAGLGARQQGWLNSLGDRPAEDARAEMTILKSDSGSHVAIFTNGGMTTI